MFLKLTGIFSINQRIGTMVEITKEVSGKKVYTLVHKNNVLISENEIKVSAVEINRLAWFFKKIK